MVRILQALTCVVSVQAAPATMKAVVASRSAAEGDFSKVKVVTDHAVPKPGRGEVLIKVAASSVNPVDWKLISESAFDAATLFGLRPKVLGFDVAGVVEEVGAGCSRLQAGDEVWADLGKTKVLDGFIQLGAWAEYAVADESQVGMKPKSLSFENAATLPLVALTDLQALRMTGAPWKDRQNVTVVVTSGSGGTGTAAVQMARAMGARRVITAASPSHFELLKSLGATDIIDYHKGTIWDSLQNETVDVVYDNYGAPGTADSAMASLKSDGVFVFLPGKGGDVSKHPKPGVKQINYGLCDSSKHEDLDALQELADAGQLTGVVPESYALDDILKALNSSVAGHAVGKIGINVSSLLDTVLV